MKNAWNDAELQAYAANEVDTMTLNNATIGLSARVDAALHLYIYTLRLKLIEYADWPDQLARTQKRLDHALAAQEALNHDASTEARSGCSHPAHGYQDEVSMVVSTETWG